MEATLSCVRPGLAADDVMQDKLFFRQGSHHMPGLDRGPVGMPRDVAVAGILTEEAN
jgi:hypothetical protein